jgi:hypothetical protein
VDELPVEPRYQTVITIATHPRTSSFDGERGEPNIGYKVSFRLEFRTESGKQGPMMGARLDPAEIVPTGKVITKFDGSIDWRRWQEYPWMRHDAHESGEGDP